MFFKTKKNYGLDQDRGQSPKERLLSEIKRKRLFKGSNQELLKQHRRSLLWDGKTDRKDSDFTYLTDAYH